MVKPEIRSILARSPLEITLLAGFFLLAIIWAVASVWFPFGWDQGIMASVGDTIVRGGMPYRDAWDMKGPFAFYGYALAQWIFGRNMWGIRLLDLLLLAVSTVALGRMVGRMTSPAVGVWAAIAFVLWYGSLTWFFVSQPDGWAAMLALMAVAPFARQSSQLTFRDMARSGFLIGCCALIKPFYAGFLVAPALFAATSRESVSRKSSAVVVAGASAMVPALLVMAWFAHRGALDSLIEVHFTYAAAYADSMRPDQIARRIFNYFWSTGVPLGVPTPAGAVAVILPAVGFAAYALWRERRQLALVLLAWLGFALVCVAIQGKFWFYHWAPTFPPFIALGAIGLHGLVEANPLQAPVGLTFAKVSMALFMMQVMVIPSVDVTRWLLYVTGIQTNTAYYSQYFRRNYVAANEVEAARYIREHTREADTVLVWGNDATIAFLSGRLNSNRFVFAMPLTREEVRGPLRSAYRKEYIEAIRTKPPRYIVIGQPHDGSSDKDRDLRNFPEFHRFIKDHYRLDHKVGFLDLYCRRME